MPEPENATFDFPQRLRAHRERAGKSRTVIGGLVGRSAEWVKALERGKMLTPRLPMLLRLAEALDITDLADLTGSQSIPVASVTKAGHEATPAIADALRQPAGRLDEPADVTDITARVDQAWHLWHRSDRERTTIATVLPDLLARTRAGARGLSGTDRRRALAQLARVYHLAQLFMAFQPAENLVWLTADRAQQAAEDADDPLPMASAAWYYSHVYRLSNQHDAAEQVARDALALLDPEADSEQLARWGQLQLAIALTNSAGGHDGAAWRAWDDASRAADRLGPGYVHPWLLFGRGAVDAYVVQLHADLGRPSAAARHIEQFDAGVLPSRTRRAGYLLQGARAQFLRGETVATMHLLGWALRESVETVRHNSFARMASLELMARPGPAATDARELALAIGTAG